MSLAGDHSVMGCLVAVGIAWPTEPEIAADVTIGSRSPAQPGREWRMLGTTTDE
jgi:hypothetical protein